MAKATRSLDAYSIHGHSHAGSTQEQNLDYDAFFEDFGSRALGRSIHTSDDVVALVEARHLENRVAFRFVSGDPAETFEALNPDTGEADPINLGAGRFVVSGAWVIIDPVSRIAVVEKRRPGVSIKDLEDFMNRWARATSPNLGVAISLNPVPSVSFLAEIDSFDRIRQASVVLRRPNHSFTPDAQQLLGQIAAQSNGGTTEVVVSAERGQTLSRSSGIVQDIKDFASATLGPLVNARVKGNKRGYDGERTVSLTQHPVRETAHVDSSSPQHVQLDALDDVAAKIIEDLPATEEIERRRRELTERKRQARR